MFVQHNILVSAGSRCCPSHLPNNEGFNKDTINHLKTVEHSFLNRTSILDLLQQLRQAIQKLSCKKFTFDDLQTDQDMLNLTGLTKQQFLDLLNMIEHHIRSTPTRSSKTTLGLFLMKMKTGLSDKILSTLFSISRSSIKRAVHAVRKVLMVDFVPDNLGFNHITREAVRNLHSRQLATSLFADNDDQVILVLDGTYIFIQKSNNFNFQRRSFSLHKGRPLVKPMVVVTTTGYFVSVLGPYLADSKNNDASILTHMMASNTEQIKSWVQPDHIFIVDGGFRDAISFLDELGIQTEMPAFMSKGEKQMSCGDANASRLVTKVP